MKVAYYRTLESESDIHKDVQNMYLIRLNLTLLTKVELLISHSTHI